MKHQPLTEIPAPHADFDLDALFEDDAAMDRLLSHAVIAALRDHKAAGNSIVVWRDGKVVTLTADEIILPPDEIADPSEESTANTAS